MIIYIIAVSKIFSNIIHNDAKIIIENALDELNFHIM